MQLRKEIKFEILHKSHKKKIIIGVVVLCIVGSVLIFKTTRAKYRFTQSIPFVRGVINYKPYDFKMMAMYQSEDGTNYNEISKMPSSGYVINESRSYCTKDGTNKDNDAILKTMEGVHSFSGLSKNEKCYLYFDKLNGSEYLLSKYTKLGKRASYEMLTTDYTGNVFSLEDDDGTSYYFAGKIMDNWVKFAGFYWRIVRFNGDKSVRLIYSGTTAGATGVNATIGESSFNSGYGDTMYVGYRYTSGKDHGYGTASTMQTYIDNWYKTNIVDKGYGDKVDSNAGFCGDRTSYTDTNGTTAGGGTGTTTTYYGAYIRLLKNSSNPTPIFKCTNSSDLYTITTSKKGNRSLTYPVGMITADEAVAAGIVSGARNTSDYLYVSEEFWTMTPVHFDPSHGFASVFTVGQLMSYAYMNSSNQGKTYGVMMSYSVRPVINLRADTTFKPGGNGTSSSPYEVA